MAYAPITKLEKFTSEKDDTQDAFTEICSKFKPYRLIILHILQCIYPMYSVDLQVTVTNARNFEAAELEVNYTQAINLVINGLFNLDSKLKQLSDSINQKLERYLADNHEMQIVSKINHVYHHHYPTSCGSQKHESATTVVNKITLELTSSNPESVHKSRTISVHLLANNTTGNILTTCILTSSLSTTVTSNISTTAATNNLSDICSSNTTIKPSSDDIRKL
ncbi:hypothetical protein G9A89_004787 [Geosiphon pyriformis]|nr:hypothetical protein G9A89_004787 [Geosiphon pyriformis]